MALTVEQVLALAPDASAAAAMRTLAASRAFRKLGSSGAVWGECQGSAVYQVRFARDDLGPRCTCPTRKFPCKRRPEVQVVHAQTASLSATNLPACEPDL